MQCVWIFEYFNFEAKLTTVPMNAQWWCLSLTPSAGTSIHWLMNAAAFLFESYLEDYPAVKHALDVWVNADDGDVLWRILGSKLIKLVENQAVGSWGTSNSYFVSSDQPNFIHDHPRWLRHWWESTKNGLKGWFIDVLFPLVGWSIEGFEGPPLTTGFYDDRWYTSSRPLYFYIFLGKL